MSIHSRTHFEGNKILFGEVYLLSYLDTQEKTNMIITERIMYVRNILIPFLRKVICRQMTVSYSQQIENKSYTQI